MTRRWLFSRVAADVDHVWVGPCFARAAAAAARNPSLVYHEGIAVKADGVLRAHAWVERRGDVFECSWRELGVRYFGVAVPPRADGMPALSRAQHQRLAARLRETLEDGVSPQNGRRDGG